MAERVVDALEVVEVEEGDDRGLAGGEGLGDPLLEQRAVREAGQRVLEGEPAQVAVALAAAAGAVEQREQRGQADDEQEHHDDRADPGDPVAALGERAGCGRRRRAGRCGAARTPESTRSSIAAARSKSRARISANSSSISGLKRDEGVEDRPAPLAAAASKRRSCGSHVGQRAR